MDFFQAQESARRSTVWLALLFVLAIAAIVFLLYAVVAFALTFDDPELPWWDPDLLVLVAAGTLGVIVAGTLYKMVKLARGGGAAIATAMGGVVVERNASDLLEQRLCNVVEEMAIASGVPVPRVYLLPSERSLNAFAAGARPNEAVVVVTRGLLETLSRDELQGVIAHEFSHILNGDMRINLRLVWVLHGLLMIALVGRGLMEGGKGSGGFALGLVAFVIGYVGVFAGEIIKAAISRQREFLADAAAVQFTRNPQGVAGALRKAANDSQVGGARVEEASHMFFAPAIRFTLFDSHPPVEERIRRIDAAAADEGSSSAQPEPLVRGGAVGEVTDWEMEVRPFAMRKRVGRVEAGHVEYAQQLVGGLPASLKQALNEAAQAPRLVCALIVAPAADALGALRAALPEGEAHAAFGYVSAVRDLAEEARLPFLQLALPALGSLSPEARAAFLARLAALCEADGRITIFEAALTALVQNVWAPQTKGGKRPRLAELRGELEILLSLLAHAGGGDEARCERAFRAGVTRLPLSDPWTLRPKEQRAYGQLSAVLDRFARLDYRSKGILIEVCAATVVADEVTTVPEEELMRTIGAVLGCPIPPLLGEPAHDTSDARAPRAGASLGG
jgi:Zn-dependent protease with chaperone function